MAYDKLEPTDQLVVNQGDSSYSITVDTLKDEMANYDKLQATDLMLVNRGDASYSVEVGTLSDEIGGGGGGNFTEVTIAPLNVTPAPADTTPLTATPVGISTILPGSEITYTWYQYNAITGGTPNSTLRTFTSSSAITDAYTPQGGDMGKFIGCTISYLGTAISETTRATIGVADVPVAAMRGLRFDENRETLLTSNTTTALSDTFTASLWVKPSKTDGYNQILVFTSSGNGPLVGIANGQWNLFNNAAHFSGSTAAVGEWAHLVVKVESGSATLYVNNTETVTCSSFTPTAGILIGDNRDTGSNYSFDGYISDVYVVDGRAVDPDVFGKQFTLGWGPLDSSAVKANIGDSPLSPYDTRPNMDTMWRNYGDVNNVGFGTSWANVFDGDINTNVVSEENKTISWNYGSELGTSAKIYFRRQQAATGTITINGSTTNNAGVSYVSMIPNDNLIIGLDVGSGLTSFSLARNGGGGSGFYIHKIEIDGRLLVDGPADNSKVWSDSWTTTNIISPGNAFDGEEASYAQTGNNNPQDIGFDFETPFNTSVSGLNVNIIVSTTTSMTLWFGKNGEVTSANSDDGVLINTDTSPTYVMIPSNGSDISSIEFGQKSGVGAVRIHAVKIGNIDLIDAGAQWDTSQVWSNSNVSVDQGGSYTDLRRSFDGNLSTDSGTASNGLTASYDFVADLSGTLEWYTPAQSAGQGWGIDGGQIGVTVSNVPGWYSFGDITNASTININSAGSTTVAAFRLNGEILVDRGSFGTNGFYLPFNPNADNYIYSLSGTGAVNANRGWDKAFNGLTSPGDQSVNPAQNSVAELIFPTAIPFKSLALWAGYGGSAANNSFLINDVDVTGQIGSAQARYPITIPGATELEKIKINTPPSGFDALILAVEVDGKLLVDHNSIGADDSGNGVNFYDKNMAVGNISQVWSSYFSSTTGFSQPARNGFDANPATQIEGTSTTDVMALSYTFENVTSLRVKFRRDGNIPQYSITMSGNGFDNVVAGGTSGAGNSDQWLTANLTSSTVSGIQIVGSLSTGPTLCMLEVNGKVLVDGNIADSVVDSPINSYAILTAGKNGNLETPISGIIPATYGSSDDIYWEFTKYNSTELNVRVSPMTSTDATASFYYSTLAGLWSEFGTPSSQSGITPLAEGDRVGVAINYARNELTVFANDEVIIETNLGGNTKLRPSVAQAGAGAFNFGQQLFASSLATHNLEAGTVELNGFSTENTSEVWSDDCTLSGATTSGTLALVFNGDFEGGGPGLGVAGANNGSSQSNPAKITFNSVIKGSKVEVSASYDGQQHGRVNNLPFTPLTKFGPWSTIYEGSEITINSVSLYSANPLGNTWYAIRVDGKTLVDGSATENTSQVWSNGALGSFQPPGATAIFDGSTASSTWTINNDPARVNFTGLTNVTSLRVFFSTGGSYPPNPYSVVINGVTTDISALQPNGNPQWCNVPNLPANAELEAVILAPSGQGSLHAIEVNGKILVNPDGFPGGSYKTINLSWTEQQAVTYQARIASADVLMTALREHAQPYSASEDYCEGSVITAFGELWIAISDSPPTTFADLPAILTHPNWEQLGVSALS